MKHVRWFGLAMACVAAFLGTPAAAANWIYVTNDTYGSVYYYDAATIQRSGNQVTVWRKSDHSRDKTFKERETKLRQRYDCSERTSALLNSTTFYPDGETASENYSVSEQIAYPLPPDTIAEKILEAVCAATAP
jgi:hypothetical protein